MKKIAFAMLILLLSVPASAENIRSAFGFVIELPSEWLVVTPDKVRERPSVVEAAIQAAQKNENLSGVWQDVWTYTEGIAKEGKVEYYFSPQNPGFTVSVHRGDVDIPEGDASARQVCASIPDEFSKITGRTIQVYACEMKALDDRNALHLILDDYVKGQKLIQYQVQRQPGEALLFTAVSRGLEFEEMKDKFEDFMEAVDFVE